LGVAADAAMMRLKERRRIKPRKKKISDQIASLGWSKQTLDLDQLAGCPLIAVVIAGQLHKLMQFLNCLLRCQNNVSPLNNPRPLML